MDDRRSTQRIRLFTPVNASTEEGPVLLLDLSASGARLEHRFAIRVGSPVVLRLVYGGQTLVIEGVSVRCKMHQRAKRVVYQSAVQFADTDERIVEAVKELIRTIVGEDLPARFTYAN